MGRDPEPDQAREPHRGQDREQVVPGVDSGQVEDGEADPQARVAVAPRLQVEARDRDQEDGEVGLRHEAAEDGADRVREEVAHRGEDEARDQSLAGHPALLRSAAVANDVSDRGGDEADRGDDVVLAVDGDAQARDGETGEDEEAPVAGLLDR